MMAGAYHDFVANKLTWQRPSGIPGTSPDAMNPYRIAHTVIVWLLAILGAVCLEFVQGG